MTCGTLIVRVIAALCRLTVDADRIAGMAGRILEGILSFPSLRKALTACLVTTACILAAYKDVSLAAKMLVVVGTIIHCTF